MSFSVLMPVYAGDCAADFIRAFKSVTDEQTMLPGEVVLVRDGEVGADLADAIDECRAISPVPVTFVSSRINRGLARALDAGLSRCRYDIVARMDADDVSVPTRFERQLPYLLTGGYDVVGSAIREFVSDAELHRPGKESPELGVPSGRIRVPPLSTYDIAKAMSSRSPFNHPSVVYRKSRVIEAGGYEDLALMEDYWLFARMVSNGARTLNLPEPLVWYRVGAGAYERRGGLKLLVSEIRLQWRFLRTGVVGVGGFLRNLLLRGGYRLVPTPLRRVLYRWRFVSE